MTKYITYNGILFLRQEDTYEIRKNQTGKIQYYAKVDTGESGMSVNGLANACGIALSGLQRSMDNPTFFAEVTTKNAKNESNLLNNKSKEVTTKPHDFYLIKTDDAHVILDIYCERVIYYYAFESHYKKTKARELYQALAQHGLRTFIHNKTGYQAKQAPQHDASLESSIEEQLKRKVEELELQLVQQKELNVELVYEIKVLKFRPKDEKTYQAYAQGMLGGQREVYLGGAFPGRVDLVTEKMVVEIKQVKKFENAFGQLLRYRAKLQGTEHESKSYVLFLFGNVTDDEYQVLSSMARFANFQLMMHRELQDYVDVDDVRLPVVVVNDDEDEKVA